MELSRRQLTTHRSVERTLGFLQGIFPYSSIPVCPQGLLQIQVAPRKSTVVAEPQLIMNEAQQELWVQPMEYAELFCIHVVQWCIEKNHLTMKLQCENPNLPKDFRLHIVGSQAAKAIYILHNTLYNPMQLGMRAAQSKAGGLTGASQLYLEQVIPCARMGRGCFDRLRQFFCFDSSMFCLWVRGAQWNKKDGSLVLHWKPPYQENAFSLEEYCETFSVELLKELFVSNLVYFMHQEAYPIRPLPCNTQNRYEVCAEQEELYLHSVNAVHMRTKEGIGSPVAFHLEKKKYSGEDTCPDTWEMELVESGSPNHWLAFEATGWRFNTLEAFADVVYWSGAKPPIATHALLDLWVQFCNCGLDADGDLLLQMCTTLAAGTSYEWVVQCMQSISCHEALRWHQDCLCHGKEWIVQVKHTFRTTLMQNGGRFVVEMLGFVLQDVLNARAMAGEWHSVRIVY
jgi:hypothetical protein